MCCHVFFFFFLEPSSSTSVTYDRFAFLTYLFRITSYLAEDVHSALTMWFQQRQFYVNTDLMDLTWEGICVTCSCSSRCTVKAYSSVSYSCHSQRLIQWVSVPVSTRNVREDKPPQIWCGWTCKQTSSFFHYIFERDTFLCDPADRRRQSKYDIVLQ